MPIAVLGWTAAIGMTAVLVHQLREAGEDVGRASQAVILVIVIAAAWQVYR